MKTIICLASMLLTYLSCGASADCISCTQSYGVKITLVNGSQESAYTTWNSFYLEGFQTDNLPEDVRVSLAKSGQDSESQFKKWIDLMNFAFSGKIPFSANFLHENRLHFYKQFTEISFPIRFYAVVQEDFLSIPISDILKIEKDDSLKQRIDLNNIPVLSTEEVKDLKNGAGHYFSKETEMGSTAFYVLRSSSLPPMDLLGHLLGGEGRDSLSFDGEEVSISRYDFGGFNVNCVGKLVKYRTTCAKLRKRLEHYQLELEQVNACKREYQETLQSLKRTTDYLSASKMPEAKRKENECSSRHKSLLSLYGLDRLSETDLRKLGVIFIAGGTD